MIYTGIGARDTPGDVLIKMSSVGRYMAASGWALRSGGAQGADTAFERGCNDQTGTKEIYLPWKNFRGNESPLFGTTKDARLLAKQFHPRWEILGDAARDFMGRNAYQILGLDLNTPTTFIICWTKDGKITGGTGQALRMADHFKIPVINFGSLSDEEVEHQISTFVEGEDYVPSD